MPGRCREADRSWAWRDDFDPSAGPWTIGRSVGQALNEGGLPILSPICQRFAPGLIPGHWTGWTPTVVTTGVVTTGELPSPRSIAKAAAASPHLAAHKPVETPHTMPSEGIEPKSQLKMYGPKATRRAAVPPTAGWADGGVVLALVRSALRRVSSRPSHLVWPTRIFRLRGRPSVARQCGRRCRGWEEAPVRLPAPCVYADGVRHHSPGCAASAGRT